MKILSAKLLDSNFIQQYKSQGIIIDCVEVIKTVPQQMDSEVLKTLVMYHALAFTSSHAVQYAGSSLLEAAAAKPVYAVSGKTNLELEKHNITARAVADNAEALAAVIIKQGGIKNVLHPCGNKSLEVFGNLLRRANIGYRQLVVYKTQLLYPAVKGSYDAIMFFSPSGVESFFRNNGPDLKTIYCCVGQTTATCLGNIQNGLDIIVANKPLPENMIEKITGHYKAKQKNA